MPLVTDAMLLREARIKDAVKLTRRLRGLGFVKTAAENAQVWERTTPVSRVEGYSTGANGFSQGQMKVKQNKDGTYTIYTVHNVYPRYARYQSITCDVITHENVRLADVASTIQKDWDAHKVTGRRNVWWSLPS